MKIILLLTFFLASTSYSKEQIWRINQDHSEVLFNIPYLSFSSVAGRFSRFSGSLTFDEDLTLPESISISIEVDSIYTANKLRDGHLKGGDFFQANRFPLINFSTKKITPSGPQEFMASGVMKIRNISQKVDIIFKLSEEIKDSWNNISRFASFKFKIKRSLFKLNWKKEITNSKYLVGDIINVSGNFQLQPRFKKTLNSKHLIPDTKEIRLREKLSRGEIRKEDIKSLKTIEPLLPAPAKTTINSQLKPTIHNLKSSKGKDTLWWIAYYIIGCLGMLSVILSSYFGKKYFAYKKEKTYSETGLSGFLTDLLITFPLIMIYSVSMWYLGFGS